MAGSRVDVPAPAARHLAGASYFAGRTASLERCHRRYGDVFRFWFPVFGSVIVLAEPEAVRTVFLDRETTAIHQPRARAIRDVVGGEMMAMIDGEPHLHRRRLLLPRFNGRHLAGYEDLIADVVRARARRLATGDTISLTRFMPELTLQVITRVLFCDDDSPTTRRFRSLLPRFARMWPLMAMLPEVAKSGRAPGPGRSFARLRDELHGLIQREIDRHRHARDPKTTADVCSLLISATDEDGKQLSDQLIRTELLGLAIGGTHTTSISMSWVFDCLLHDPDTLARLEDDPSDSQLAEAVVSETLRFRPIVDGAPRLLLRDMELSGVAVPAGEVVFPSIYLLHRRPQAYPRPHEWLPARFLGRKPPRDAWLPFGGGAHRCLAAGLAQLELRVVLQELLKHRRLRPVRPSPSRPRRSGIFWMPAGGVQVKVVRR